MSFKVDVYLGAGIIHSFPAKDIEMAREIATRQLTEGLWVKREDKTEEFYPPHRIYKIKIYEGTEGSKLRSVS